MNIIGIYIIYIYYISRQTDRQIDRRRPGVVNQLEGQSDYNPTTWELQRCCHTPVSPTAHTSAYVTHTSRIRSSSDVAIRQFHPLRMLLIRLSLSHSHICIFAHSVGVRVCMSLSHTPARYRQQQTEVIPGPYAWRNFYLHTNTLMYLVSTYLNIHASDDTNVDERAHTQTHTLPSSVASAQPSIKIATKILSKIICVEINT